MKWLLLFFLLCTPGVLAYGHTHHLGCIIGTENGQFNDLDCDRVPDIADNCPDVQNTEQGDVDRNGVGDFCDIVIDEITIEPTEPLQGRSTLIRVGIFNNRPYEARNLVLKVEVPTLGILGVEMVQSIRPGQRAYEEVLVRIPVCAPARFTDFVAIVEYPYAPGQKEVFSNAVKVPIAESGECASTSGELTVVDILEVADVLPGEGALYPFTIKNNWPDSKSYILTAQGHEGWGVVEISPGSVVVVPGGGARDGQLRVWNYDGITGKKSFTLTVQARDDIKQVLLQANIPDIQRIDVSPAAESRQFFFGLIVFLGILVLIVIVAMFMREKHMETKRKKSKNLKR